MEEDAQEVDEVEEGWKGAVDMVLDVGKRRACIVEGREGGMTWG